MADARQDSSATSAAIRTRLSVEEDKVRKKPNHRVILVLSIILLILVALTALGMGRIHVPPFDAAKILLSKVFAITQTWDQSWEIAIITVRLPRICAAMLVGAGLAVSGACYQTVFRNPLVSPDILGASGGAGLGAALAFLLGFTGQVVQAFAFCGALLAVALTYLLAKTYRRESSLMLVLSGIIVGAFFSSALSFIKSVADTEDVLPNIVYWLMGSLQNTFFRHIEPILIPMGISFVVLLAISWKLNVLGLGENEAKSLGINIKRMRLVVIFFATVLTASAVCVSGTIGWVGLVIPHMARFVVGADVKKMLPVAMVMGAIFMLIVDTVARTITFYEVSLGILTGLIGAPVFALLLYREKERVR